MSALSAWQGFFGAVSSATATLIGFVFVAVSINLSRILDTPGLPGRAAEAVVTLAAILVIALLGLVPALGTSAFGMATLAIAVILTGFSTGLHWSALRHRHFRYPIQLVVRVMFAHAGLLPLLAAGALLAAGYNVGMGWLVFSIAATIIANVLNAWVLLVEILR